MVIAKHEKRTHFRGKARPGRRVELTYRPRGAADTPAVAAVTRNIGVGGAFIASESLLPVGTKLDLLVHMPTAAEPLELTAEVRWQSGPGDDPEEVGMGVQFLNLGVEALLRLSEYFASLTGTEE